MLDLIIFANFLLTYKVTHLQVSGIKEWTSSGAISQSTTFSFFCTLSLFSLGIKVILCSIIFIFVTKFCCNKVLHFKFCNFLLLVLSCELGILWWMQSLIISVYTVFNTTIVSLHNTMPCHNSIIYASACFKSKTFQVYFFHLFLFWHDVYALIIK